jgi:hypothetical protein
MSYIKDELLLPYYIEVTERSFNVREIKGFKLNKKTGVEEEVFETHGYMNSLYASLRKIAFLKNLSIETMNLSEYVSNYERITKELIEAIKE